MEDYEQRIYRPVLTVIDSRGEPRSIDLQAFGKSEIRIGRKEDQNDIVIPEAFVSSRHGRIYLTGTHLYYRDEHSSNGSYVTTSSRTSFLKNSDSCVELSANAAIRIGSRTNPNQRVLIWFAYMGEG